MIRAFLKLLTCLLSSKEMHGTWYIWTAREIFRQDKTRQDKTRQLYLTRVAQSAARLVSLGALGSIKLYINIYNKITRWSKIC